MSYAQRLMETASKSRLDYKPKESEPENKEPVQEAAPENNDQPEEIKAEENAPEEEIEEDFETISKRTRESLEDEVKKLREKEAEKRIKLKKQNEIFEAERQQYEAKVSELAKRLEELESSKEKKAEAEIDANEKLHTREKALEELRSSNQELMKKLEAIEKERKEREDREAEEKRLHEQVVREKFKDILKSIPEDKQKYAERIFKGHDDLEDGLYAVLEAKNDGLFGKKKIEVVHKPTITQTVETTEQPQKKLTSRDKIKRGLAEKLKGGLKQGRL